ncbi:MAG: MMPL family transporter [Proteobacteria bacterium]|nr:MMPL family transporter [Pseudomonadota bacterium]
MSQQMREARRALWGERIIGTLYDHKWLALVAALILTGLAGWQASSVGVDNAVEIWFLEDDPALVAYHDFQETYGNDEVVAIAVHDPAGILTVDGYARMREVERIASQVDGIGEVRSLASSNRILANGFTMEIRDLVPPDLADIGDEAALRDHILSDPLLVSRLVSEDGTTALVLARMESMDDVDARRDGILIELEEQLADVPHHSAGIGVVYTALNQMATVDSAVFIGASYAVIILLLLVLYRRILPVVVTMGTVGIAATWLMGAFGGFGRDINMVTMVLPTLVVIIGISDCVHILSHAAQQSEGTRRERVVRAVGFMFWPCLFNTLTTAVGFLALCTAPMAVIRDMGMFAAIGLVAAFVAAIVACTLALSTAKSEPASLDRGWIQRGVDALADIGIRKSPQVLVVTALLGLLCAVGISRLEVDTYSIDFLLDDHPVRQDSQFIEDNFGFYMPLEVVVKTSGEPLDPQLLQAVDSWTAKAVNDPDIGWSASVVDVVKHLNQAILDGGPDDFRVPGSIEAVEQALLLYDGEGGRDLDEFKQSDSLRVTFGMRMMSAQGMSATLDRVLATADMPDGVELVPSGYLPLYAKMMDYIVVSQLTSFGLAFVIVFGLLALLFRSIRVAALAVPANLLPVLFVLGLMGVLGIRLDVATVTIAAIVLGLVVDDTVQFLYRFRAEFDVDQDHEAAVRRSVGSVGRSLAVTTVVLALGFSVLGLANVKSVIYFGLLISAAMVFALLMDLLVLPAVIMLVRPKL